MTTRRPATAPFPTPAMLYTPARARRLATLTRGLWAEMIGIVGHMLQIASHHDPDTLSEQRMILRTLQITLRGYSTEHRLWASLRQHGADRDNDNSLFRFLDQVHDIASPRLDALEAEVAMVAKGVYGAGSPEQHFGLGFCEALKALRTAFIDWSTLTGQLDSIDSTEAITAVEIEARDREIAAIEASARVRRQGSPIPTRAAAKKTVRRRPPRR